MTHTRPHVLVADDEKDIRQGLICYLTHLGYEAAGAADGEQALALAAGHSFDVALVDVLMPPPAGLELARQLKEAHPQIEIIIVTAYSSAGDAAEAMHQGAFYYMPKPLDLQALESKVREAFARSIETARDSAALARIKAALSALTRREQEVLALLSNGLTDGEAAERLKIGTSTVNTHVCNILHKLQVKNRVQAIVLAMRYDQLVRKIPNFMDRQPDKNPL